MILNCFSILMNSLYILLTFNSYNLEEWLLKQHKQFQDNLAPVLTFQLDRSDQYGLKINTPFQYPDVRILLYPLIFFQNNL